jgi:hypothetical protein
MLISLVAVPAIALFWKQIPDAVDRIWVAIEKQRNGGVAAAQNDPMAPEWANAPAPGTNQPLQEAPRYEAPGTAPAGVDPRAAAAHGAAPAATASVATQQNMPPQFGGGAPPIDASTATRQPAPPVNPVRPAGYNEPIVRGQAPGSIEEPMPVPATDEFTAMQHRLRQLGATYYLLESWGSDGALYRFHCKMAIAGNSRYTRHFEATDREPLRAIGRVLRDVEQWRAGRTP